MKYYTFEYIANLNAGYFSNSLNGCSVLEFHPSESPITCYEAAKVLIENKERERQKEINIRSVEIIITKMTPIQ
jgi:hypothetical protein